MLNLSSRSQPRENPVLLISYLRRNKNGNWLSDSFWLRVAENTKMGIHFPELKDIDKPVVWVFPEVVVCLDCGTAEFAVPEAELRQLAKGDAAAG